MTELIRLSKQLEDSMPDAIRQARSFYFKQVEEQANGMEKSNLP